MKTAFSDDFAVHVSQLRFAPFIFNTSPLTM